MKPTNLLSILALTVVLTGALANAQQFHFATLAGQTGGPRHSDGTGSAARFYDPTGVAVDRAGNVYVADTYNHTIRKISPEGVVSTLAGLAGSEGSDDGTGSAARFSYPHGVAVDSAGNVYVADTYNLTIRKITPGGVVSTLAGLAGSFGSNDGSGSAARFGRCDGRGCGGPFGVAVDSAGNVYVADTFNLAIRKITPGGLVSTLAGLVGSVGSEDGTRSAARFYNPFGVAVDNAGNVYVADTGNRTVRKIMMGGAVSTLAGLAGSGGSADGTGSTARFAGPFGVTVDSADNVYVGDGGSSLRKITPGGVVSTLAGLAGSTGNDDGTGSAARFKYLSGVTVDSAGNLYVADSGNHTIRKVTSGEVVSTLAGQAQDWDGSGFNDGAYADGTGSDARFNSPAGVAVDSAGNVYVADTFNLAIRKITPGGVVGTLAGLAVNFDSADGTASAARFKDPRGVAVDSAGTVYVADTYNHTIRKITPGGVVIALAGLTGIVGSADGMGSAARFNYPSSLAVDSAGNVYVADTDNHTIRKIMPGGLVSTLAGLAQDTNGDGSPNGGYADGRGNLARFNGPSGVAVDRAGNVYVADSGNGTIRKITPGGVVSTLAGLAGNFGSDDGTGSAARFGGCNLHECGGPIGLAVDSADNIYVADWNHTIRKITPGGRVSTLAGLPGKFGDDDGTGSAARFKDPRGVAVDSVGNLYVADTYNHKIRLGTPVLLTQPAFSPNISLRLSSGQFQIEVTASTNQLVLIQAASVFAPIDWTTVQTVTLWNGRMTLIDPGASSFPFRFYRAVSPVP